MQTLSISHLGLCVYFDSCVERVPRRPIVSLFGTARESPRGRRPRRACRVRPLVSGSWVKGSCTLGFFNGELVAFASCTQDAMRAVLLILLGAAPPAGCGCRYLTAFVENVT